MYPTSFDYHKPRSLADAAALLEKDPEARLLAGGRSLLPAMKLRLATPGACRRPGRDQGLAGIQPAGGRDRGVTTHATVASSDVVRSSCALLAETA